MSHPVDIAPVVTTQPQTAMGNPLEPSRASTPVDRLSPWNTPQLVNLVIGLIGIQFAWSMQISLSNQVTEPLGADPLIKGIIWCAGPITGILVQPIVGSWSDRTWTLLGRRRPFILSGAVLGALALLAFPYASSLLMAGALIWVIDACVNLSQGPYRALVPDNLPASQTTVGNSYMNAAIAIGAVISLGVPALLTTSSIAMTIPQQFLMAAIALVVTTLYSSLTIRERQPATTELAPQTSNLSGPAAWLQTLRDFRQSDPQVFLLCGVQFLTWIGVMCLFINLTDFVVHNVYQLPELNTTLLSGKNNLIEARSAALGTAQWGLAAFNLISFLLTVPLGILATRLGRKRVHSLALLCMAGALAAAPLVTSPVGVIAMLSVAGIGWATILSIPFAVLADYIPPGKEGALMGMFNMFVASPQLISALGVGALVNYFNQTTPLGQTHPYWLALSIGSGSLILSALLMQRLKEKDPSQRASSSPIVAGSH